MRQKRKKKRKSAVIVLSVSGMLAGLLLLMLPFALDRYNDYRNAQTISSMTSVYDRYEEHAGELVQQLEEAMRYNRRLSGDPEAEVSCLYEEQLSFDPDGVMGYLTIPSIDLKMLVYHGTSDETLAVGVGHLEGTSLPVGGESTHSVLTAHSGMKTMRAFDDLRKLEEGDLFGVSVYGRECVYEVESIETVLPEETDSLGIVPGQDRMTLVTCTPYGINDHRLLVHGVRTAKALPENKAPDQSREYAHHAIEPDIRTIPMLLAGAVLLGFLTFTLIRLCTRRKEQKET